MIKLWQTMRDYHSFLHLSKVSFDSSERARLHGDLWEPWQKIRIFDTDKAMGFLLPFYAHSGRPALNQPQILRSFILFFLLFSKGMISSSLTLWVRRLQHDRVLAALIGCSPTSLPPLGSYYDFMNRLWTAPSSDLYSKNKLLSASWNSKKPVKPKGRHQKALESSKNITEKLANRILDGKDIPFNFEERLQKLFFITAVQPSIQAGLIPSGYLTVSGDGTAVHTHSNPRGHHPFPRSYYTSEEEFRSAKRHFSDPDASWGYDSDLEKHYFGYTLFQLSCYNSQFHIDIPLLLRFTSAKRHDSVNFLVSFHELLKNMPSLPVRDMCLDSAMDNISTYRLLKQKGIRAFIDLNSNCGHPKTIPDSIKIDKNGTPICSQGFKMIPNGYDRSKDVLMWRCPFKKDHVSKCPNSCTSSAYGRVIKTKTEWDIRLYTEVPRGTEEYKKIYRQRTATERINNRILNHYGLHRLMIHTKKHYSFMTTLIGICIHLDGRYKMSHPDK